MSSGQATSQCIKCASSFEVTEPKYPALCCDSCNHANEIQCACGNWDRPKWCSVYHAVKEGCVGCENPGRCRLCCKEDRNIYSSTYNTCDVCHARKFGGMIGTGRCKQCKFVLDICDNCIKCMEAKTLKRVCAKCTLGTWRVTPTQGLTQEWMQAMLPNVKVEFH